MAEIRPFGLSFSDQVILKDGHRSTATDSFSLRARTRLCSEGGDYYDTSDLPSHSSGSLTPRETSETKRQARYPMSFEVSFYRPPSLMNEGPALETAMPDDELKQRTTDFMHALASSEADVANITADRTEGGMVVTFDLLDSDDADLVREVAAEHGFETTDDTNERFTSQP